MTDRHKKLAYIDGLTGEDERRVYRLKRAFLADRLANEPVLYARDILEVIEGDINDAAAIEYMTKLKTQVDDHVIASIDWNSLRLCKQCGEYYDPCINDTGFCSDDCEDVNKGDSDDA